MNNRETVAFVGTGVMGNSMAGHLLRAGYHVNVYTRTKEKAENLISSGAKWCSTPAEAVADAKYTITIVGYPKDVEEVYFGKDGILENAKQGSFVIDMTTSTPSLAKKIYAAAKEKGIYSLDAPVSGGDVGAKEARLTIMVGGDKDAYKTCLPLFERMGKNIVLQGEAGSGQHTKMCNQIAIATNMIGVCESLAYAKSSGLDPVKVLETITTGAANSFSLSKLAPRILAGDFEPGFYVKHFIKDMGIALAEAEAMGLKLPGLSLAIDMYEELANKGEENSGTQALYKLWEM
ncbi:MULTISPECIES: NAD(P)-dependent oxidoreductase [Sutcliffiella]|uniref:Oxidoreductase n=1 Tax=Sutcliffiella cohnii TaxID=33932 RepID=A0A223KQ63_9BACI|nr:MULTISPECIES: NAD(P)-dependent oxidoreductase [Sutcliffiella]AST91494.1 oxidoreductase [Sutcliffiella cohnii]MED4014939.1 NAD(P)-dependent oxidoreductase [Sutcliffiella cohnii]WBL17326.1 NAD(P)-dependent oxidoreductase [Sutcliffiella sp. NC1]